MSSIVDRFKKTVAAVKPLITIYGPEGTGKTTLAAQIGPPDDTVFLVGENDVGLVDLIDRKQLEQPIPHEVVSKWDTIRQVTAELISQEHPYKYVVFDQLSSMQGYLFNYVAKEKFGGDLKEFLKFNNGSELAVSEWEGWWNDLSRLRHKATVICLAHATTNRFDNPEGQGWMRYEIDLFRAKQGNKNIDFSSIVKKSSSELGFIQTRVYTDKGKGKGGYDRVINFTHCASYDAKNRWGITDSIELGSNPKEMGAKFREGLKEAIKDAKESK